MVNLQKDILQTCWHQSYCCCEIFLVVAKFCVGMLGTVLKGTYVKLILKLSMVQLGAA